MTDTISEALPIRTATQLIVGSAPVVTELFVPDDEATNAPRLSIVIPALNEEITISEFVRWCHEGLVDANVDGEIIIVDSSTDSTPQIALNSGARVLRTPKRGLGRAYMDAIPFIRGDWVLMGDADCTYDFRQLRPFVERFKAGDDFVMGSRWAGTIEPGAMPKLHQYFGTPLTTWILNVLYGSSFTDIHCGMRGMTRDALRGMSLMSSSWEYASEIVLKSVHMDLVTSEVPVTFLKDKEGRQSHHRRMGWFSPFHAAWINLRAMFVYGADFFSFKPGMLILGLGLLVTLPLIGGPITVGSITFSLYWMLFGMILTVIGFTGVLMGAISRVLLDRTGRQRERWAKRLPYTPTIVASVVAIFTGICMVLPMVIDWMSSGYKLSDPNRFIPHLAVGGLTMVVCGTLLFGLTLLLHAAITVKAEAEQGGGRVWHRVSMGDDQR